MPKTDALHAFLECNHVLHPGNNPTNANEVREMLKEVGIPYTEESNTADFQGTLTLQLQGTIVFEGLNDITFYLERIKKLREDDS